MVLTEIARQGTTTRPHVPGPTQDLYLLVMIRRLIGSQQVQRETVIDPSTRSGLVQSKGHPL